MSTINFDELLQPVSDALPCGEDLEYDAEFQEMERAAQGKPETQFSEAEPPDWKDVQKHAIKILSRTRDLRPLLMLARAALKMGDLPTFGHCIALIPQWLEQYWEHVYPQLDPDDQDPEFRVNSIASLALEPTQFNDDTFVTDLRETPLVSSRAGQFSLRDIDIAHGRLDVHFENQEDAPTESSIAAAFAECSAEQLQANANAITQALDSIRQTDTILTDKLGAAQAPDLTAIVRELSHADKVFNEHVQTQSPDADAANTNEEPAIQDATATTNPSAPTNQAFSGKITSRADVVRALDLICEYYRLHEPSSPIPLLLERAKRLTSKSFVEIMEDLSPSALAELAALRGNPQGDE